MRFTPTFFTILSIAFTLSPAVRADTRPEATVSPAPGPIVIDGSSSLATVNQALKEAFERKYPDAKVALRYGGTEKALQALEDGSIDLAAIGRPLTDAEKAKGYRTIALPRRKIAIVVSPENPFRGSLSDRQFAAIARGEITDWSRLGREPGRIRLIDRYRGDTRQSFSNYGIFPSSLTTGANTIPVDEDSTSVMTRELGRDGIGYAIADQAVNNPNLRVVSMFNTQATDPRYPFSQPRYLVYKDATRPAARRFLDFVNSSAGKTIIDTAPPIPETILHAGSTAEPPSVSESSPTVSASPTATTAGTGLFSWGWLWLLLPLVLLGGFESWWRSRRVEREMAEDSLPPLAGGSPLAILPPAPIVADENESVATPSEIPSLETDPIADFLESLIDSDLDTEALIIESETVADHPFPTGKRKRVAAPPVAALDRPEFDARQREAIAGDRETLVDFPFFSEAEEEIGQPSGFPSGIVPLAATNPFGVDFPSNADTLHPGDLDPTETFPVAPVVPNRHSLEANARSHCYALDDLRWLDLNSRSNCLSLGEGTYRIKIAGGFFRYGSDDRCPEGEPWVLLWIFGGRFMNRQTKVETGQTWVSLNGHEDELILRVLEPTRLCGLFFDTRAADNQGEIQLSIERAREGRKKKTMTADSARFHSF